MCGCEGSRSEDVSEARRKSKRSEEPYDSATSRRWGSERMGDRNGRSLRKATPETICSIKNPKTYQSVLRGAGVQRGREVGMEDQRAKRRPRPYITLIYVPYSRLREKVPQFLRRDTVPTTGKSTTNPQA